MKELLCFQFDFVCLKKMEERIMILQAIFSSVKRDLCIELKRPYSGKE